jgi:hypothetical protein
MSALQAANKKQRHRRRDEDGQDRFVGREPMDELMHSE